MKQTVKRDVKIYNYNAEQGGTVSLTLSGVEGEEVTLSLSDNQAALLNSRFERAFYKRCQKDKILSEIDNARSYSELEAIAKKYYLCDTCDFSDINLYGVKRTLKVVVEVLYKYPKLRSRLCYIGTHDGFEELLERLERGDVEVLKNFNLQYICTKESAEKLGKIIRPILEQIMQDTENYVATAVSAYGLLDAILLDKNDYKGYAYLEFVSGLRLNAVMGFHPKGCHSPESVVYHELGHILDYMCELSKDRNFVDYYNSLTKHEIKKGLSEYALCSPEEFIAEAFAEYMCNPSPRPIATKVAELLDALYNKSK